LTKLRDSLSVRYATRLVGGAITMPVNALTQAIGNRYLGPEGLGIFSYTVGIFTEICGFIDSGLGIAYYRKLCAEPANRAWVGFFSRLVLALLGIFVAGVAVAAATGWGRRLWGEIPLTYVALGAAVALLTWLVSLVGKASDAHGLTKKTEISRVAVRVLLFGFMLGVAALGGITLQGFFALQLTALALLILVWIVQVERAGQPFFRLTALAPEAARRERVDLLKFVSPLFAYSAVGMAGGLFDRWLLLSSAGEAQQGFYAVGLQLGALCFVFTSALTQLLVGEYTRAVAQGDVERLRRLFQDSVGSLYVVACFLGMFCAANVTAVLAIYGGNKFAGAETAVAILCLYPLHQTYGQLSGSLFLAAGESKRYSWIGICTTLVGMIVTGVLVAKSALGLGAVGLAVKMVAVQLLLVNIQLFFNARSLGLSFLSLVRQQCGVAAVFALAAFGTAWVAGQAVGSGRWALAVSALLYAPLGVWCVWQLNLAGLRAPLRAGLQKLGLSAPTPA